MIKIKGVNVWPDAVSRVLDRYPDIQEHRGRVYLDQHGREVALLDVELAHGADPQKTLSKASAALREELGIGFELREWRGSAPLNSLVFNPQTGKTRRWEDRRHEGPLSPQ